MSEPIWRPSSERVANSNLTAFMHHVHKRWNVDVSTYDKLWQWSVDELEQFWISIWDYCEVIAETRGARVATDIDKMPGAVYFPDAILNFAENFLRRKGPEIAIHARSEGGAPADISFDALHAEVSRLQQALRAAGIVPGDRVAAFMPNTWQIVAVMLAATSLGGVFSSCSPDFGVRGALDRIGQIEPKILFATDGYFYNGKIHSNDDKLPELVAGLPTVQKTIVAVHAGASMNIAKVRGGVMWDDFIAPYKARAVEYTRLPFNHPVYIMYTSGTTGVPKCILHRAGGLLLQNMKEAKIHADVKRGEKCYFYTNTSWMVWNIAVAYLSVDASMVVYDGSPFYPSANVQFDLIDETGANLFGSSAKFFDAILKLKLRPVETHDLSSLRIITTSGSGLLPEAFEYIHRDIKRDVHVASVSGGTDLGAGFAVCSPNHPVYAGEMQVKALGMAVEVFDEHGKSMKRGMGELVCTKSFPSLPLCFLNDPGDARYREAYFSMYPNVWRHGDWMEFTENDGLVIHGRSDATLKPGGVRIGTAEIYRPVEMLDEVVESLVIGQDFPPDVRVVLFVRLRDGITLDAALEEKIRKQIRSHTTPRHVPAKIIQVAEIPRTKTGKIVELAVRDVVHGRPVRNRDALANPDALELYKDLAELRS